MAKKGFHFRNLLISLVEKYHPFNVRYFKVLVFVVMTLLLGTVLVLGWLSSEKIRETVTDDFNQQQLVIAHHVAIQVENSIDTLNRELILLSLSPSIQYSEIPSIINRMETTFSSIKHEGTLEIRFLEDKKKKVYHVLEKQKSTFENFTHEDFVYLDWARKDENKGNISVTNVSSVPFYNNPPRPIMKMLTPVWQVSVDESHPVAKNNFAGVLIFVIDVGQLIENIAKEIRSGKTGYAWVIDENGTFLYHQEKSFIGQNAFEARKGKKPTISFTRINEIQKDKMIKGLEGTSWYVSGWHRGIEGEIKKLIAFTPIRLRETDSSHIWSVAVVAPISEVEGAIHAISKRQFFLQGLIFFLILFGGLFINFMILSWSNMLEQEVSKKTIELKQSEQRYKSLIENAEDIIFTIDYNGNFLSINNYGTNFFNRSEEEFLNHNISEIVSWPSSDVLLAMIQKVFDTKESKQITHMVIVGEHQYWLNTNFRRLWDEEGEIYAVLGISRDITERKKMEDHSYYTEKLASMGTLAAGVAHEINNPLGIILGFTELLLEKFPPDSQEYDLLKTIEKQVLNAKRVVENLLSFAREKEHKLEDVDLNQNIQKVLAVMKNTLTINKIVIKEEMQSDLPQVIADAGELQQVFFNIINNAMHAMRDGGTLTITTKLLNNDHFEIRISDTGHGIKKEHRKRIFDPLFTTKEVGKGTGLGLAVSYGIVMKHHGIITFETKTKEESEETGTTFIVILQATQPLKSK